MIMHEHIHSLLFIYDLVPVLHVHYHIFERHGSGDTSLLSCPNPHHTSRYAVFCQKHVEDNLEIGSKVNEKRRKLLLETITNLYANPTGAVDMDEKALLRRNKSAAQVDGAARREAQGLEKEKEKERNDKQSFLSCLLEAVERWNDRERAQEARAVREVDSYNED